MTPRRLIFFIALNVVISALVTGTILYFYDRDYSQRVHGGGGTIATIAPGSVNVEILDVRGAGVLASESVMIQNNNKNPLDLTGWMLKDDKGNVYTFPSLVLYKGGTVSVHTRTGIDSAADLYWQLTVPVWKSGELVGLYDGANIVHAFYRVP